MWPGGSARGRSCGGGPGAGADWASRAAVRTIKGVARARMSFPPAAAATAMAARRALRAGARIHAVRSARLLAALAWGPVAGAALPCAPKTCVLGGARRGPGAPAEHREPGGARRTLPAPRSWGTSR